ncbi:MAG: hypothetical protein KIPDCIKN_01550 [Haliscomenobacter sp.]|jgi:hypothetical protein|nr:hypothetical protein [Haliscomenobacter sp.]
MASSKLRRRFFSAQGAARLWFGAVFLGLGMGFPSCSEPPPLKLTLSQREMADTLYLEKVKTLGPQLDSLCAAKREERLARAVDSILNVRRSEEAELRAKYKQPGLQPQ